MTTEMEDPGSYGRIVRGADGEIERIVEAKTPGDATPEELAIKEVNAGTYAFAGASPRRGARAASPTTTPRASTTSATSCRCSARSGLRVAAYRAADPGVNLGINDRADLARVTDEARRRILVGHMRAGVTIEDPGATWIDADVEIAADTTILPGHDAARPAPAIGAGSTIGPMTTLIDSASASAPR